MSTPRAPGVPGVPGVQRAPGAPGVSGAPQRPMSPLPAITPRAPGLPVAPGDEIIKIAVLAVGGQGGGVLTGWIADLATRGGWHVQTTSVPGVAQRTGATVYYIEMAPRRGREPVFALGPSPGDVDVVIAAELMEAGRAVLRGLVTPDRTTVIASSHRVLAISEKAAPGDGRAGTAPVEDALARAARALVCFDMEALAARAGSVISASLFGALARSAVLPFEVAQFEAVIAASGRGVTQSLAAFRAALEYAPEAAAGASDAAQRGPLDGLTAMRGPARLMSGWQALCRRIARHPAQAQPMIRAGLARVVDYQDLAYGERYLDHLEHFAGGEPELLRTAAKYIANAMCYDDILRVADLKTRAAREARLRREQGIAEGAIVRVSEYFHPRGQEVCGLLPAPLGAWIEARPRALALLDRLVNRGRRIRTDRIGGFALLWAIAALRPHRRRLLRHRHETAHLQALLDRARRAARTDAALAIEILRCQRLIKGYSDTHARGRSKFARVMAAADDLAGRADAADWVRRLREAALADERGAALEEALAGMRRMD
ncbi:MAG: indolepyruvate oxidoreductase subunit beta family protein [Roseovarius sp.]